MKTDHFLAGSVPLRVRHIGTPFGYWDRRIATEVQTQYNFPELDYSRIQRVLDIGCHIGSYLAWLERVNPAIEGLGIELDKDNADLARLNTIHPIVWGYCAYSVDAEFQAQSLDNSGNNIVVAKGDTPPKDWIAKSLPSIRLTVEDLLRLRHWDWVDLIKIDCEGGERDIFAHMDFSRVGTIVGEYHGGEHFRSITAQHLTNAGMRFVHCAEEEDWGLFLAVHE